MGMKYYRRLLSSVFLLLTLLAGCGQSGETGIPADATCLETSMEKAVQEMAYEFEILSIPNMYKNLMRTLPEGGYIVDDSLYTDHLFFAFINGTIYKTTTCMKQEDNEIMPLGEYIQYLPAPYDAWVDLRIPDEEDSWFQKAAVTPEERFLYVTSCWSEDSIWYRLHELLPDGSSEIVQDGLSEEELNKIWVWDRPQNFPDYYDMYSVAEGTNLATCSADDGKLYFGNGKGIWYYDGNETKQVLDFRSHDIALKKLNCLEVTDTGFLMLGSFGNKYYLMTATKLPQPKLVEKTEIILADLYVDEMLEDAVADFNMISKNYHVVIDAPSTSSTAASAEKQEQFKNEFTKSLIRGEGPDIIGRYVLQPDMAHYANNGYLMELDDYFAGREQDFFANALADNMVNEKRYGIPYSMYLYFYMGDGTKLPSKSSWDARELMNYVRNSPAKYLSFYYYPYPEGTEKIYTLYELLNDPSDTTYIDWAKGISHLNEQPFLELLQFVDEYTLTENLSFEDAGKKLQSGEVALYSTGFYDMKNLIFHDVLYNGNQKYIGYPSVAGNGVSMVTFSLYVNASSKKKKGIYAFFDYLLSDQGQTNSFTTRYPDQLPIRRETYQWMLGTSGEFSEHPNGSFSYMGFEYKYKKLSEVQKKQAIELVEHSTPYNPKFVEIQSILSEELTPYFLGTKSITEATETLHNRVQLYLNE